MGKSSHLCRLIEKRCEVLDRGQIALGELQGTSTTKKARALKERHLELSMRFEQHQKADGVNRAPYASWLGD